MNCFANAPLDIVNYILSFDNRFRISNGIPISILSKDDPRYAILKKVCRFHDYCVKYDDSERQRIDRWTLGSNPCKPLSFLQDSFYIIIVQRKNKVSLRVEHRRITIDKTTNLYYSYTIDNYGPHRSSLRIKNMKAKQLNIT
jgi:hypothetical protein